MTQQHALRFFLLALFLSSCAPKSSEILLNTDATPSTQLLKMVEERNEKLSSLVGNGVVSFESPEIAGTASFESNMKKPDSLLVTLEGPFGIDVGTLFLCRENYVMYNSLENRVVTGKPTGAAIRSVIPFDLTYDQILNAFAGVFRVQQPATTLQSYTVEDDMFVLSFKNGAYLYKYWVDPRYLLVARYEQYDAANNLLVEAKASSFIQEEDVAAARRIRITFPQQNRQVSISYSTLKLNDPETDFRFTIPANATHIIQ